MVSNKLKSQLKKLDIRDLYTVINIISDGMILWTYVSVDELMFLADMDDNILSDEEKKKVISLMLNNDYYPSNSNEAYKQFSDAVYTIKGKDFEW